MTETQASDMLIMLERLEWWEYAQTLLGAFLLAGVIWRLIILAKNQRSPWVLIAASLALSASNAQAQAVYEHREDGYAVASDFEALTDIQIVSDIGFGQESPGEQLHVRFSATVSGVTRTWAATVGYEPIEFEMVITGNGVMDGGPSDGSQVFVGVLTPSGTGKEYVSDANEAAQVMCWIVQNIPPADEFWFEPGTAELWGCLSVAVETGVWDGTLAEGYRWNEMPRAPNWDLDDYIGHGCTGACTGGGGSCDIEVCTGDCDGDGALNCLDPCPDDADDLCPACSETGETQIDTDGDGVPDCKDDDKDGDGCKNDNDDFPLDPEKIGSRCQPGEGESDACQECHAAYDPDDYEEEGDFEFVIKSECPDCDFDKDGCPNKYDPEALNPDVGCDSHDVLPPPPSVSGCDGLLDEIQTHVESQFAEIGISIGDYAPGGTELVTLRFPMPIPGVGITEYTLPTTYGALPGAQFAALELLRLGVRGFLIAWLAWITYTKVIDVVRRW